MMGLGLVHTSQTVVTPVGLHSPWGLGYPQREVIVFMSPARHASCVVLLLALVLR